METDVGSHLSIGEVLSLLQVEFPDVTISKIRFLESQGLIDPERTPSGYRKFYETDIERLRWVLRQQRDHFLPLKVIKAKLDEGRMGDDDPMPEQPEQPELFDRGDDPAAPTPAKLRTAAARRPTEPRPAQPAPTDAPEPESPSSESSENGEHDPAAWLAALQESPKPPSRGVPSRPVEPLLDPDEQLSGEHYSASELAARAGVDPEVIAALAEFGLLVGSTFGGETSFDDAALEVALAASAFVGRGIEPRHLRSYKLAADREAGLFEQLALPLLRQRNPQSRRQAADLVSELSDQGESLRRALLRQALRAHVTPR